MFILANVVWPALYLADNLTLWYVVIPSIFIEAAFYGKAFCANSFSRGLWLSAAANALTALFGLLGVLQVSAILPTLVHDLFIHGTFAFSGWIVNAVWCILFNFGVEYWTAKLLAKHVIYREKTFAQAPMAWIWVLSANILTFAIGMLFPFLAGHKMSF